MSRHHADDRLGRARPGPARRCAAALAVVLLGACSPAAEVASSADAAAPGTASPVPGSPAASPTEALPSVPPVTPTPPSVPPPTEEAGAPPLFSDDDIAFLEGMIEHHEQALEMSALVPDRSDREQLLRYAEDVAQVQGAEIEFMEEFLADAEEERGEEDHDAHVHDAGEHADAMLSQDEMDALAAAEGEAFERLWLEGMIRHHEGALAMAEEILAARSDHLGVAEIAHHVVEEQQYEIGLMRRWLEEWDLGDG